MRVRSRYCGCFSKCRAPLQPASPLIADDADPPPPPAAHPGTVAIRTQPNLPQLAGALNAFQAILCLVSASSAAF